MIHHDLNQSACISLVNTAEGSCDGESCTANSKREEMAVEKGPKKMGDSSTWLDTNVLKEEWSGVYKGEDGQLNRNIEEIVTLDGKTLGGMPYSSIP